MKHPKIIVRPPGRKTRELISRDYEFLSQSNPKLYPLSIDSGKHSIVKDLDGNEYIDFNAGMGCLTVGHCHPLVIDAIKKQAEKFTHYPYSSFYHEPAVKLAETLVELSPGSFSKKVLLCSCREECIEAALKVSRWHTRRYRVIAFSGSFHGSSMAALSISAPWRINCRKYFYSVFPWVVFTPYPYCFRCPFKLEYPECDLWCADYIEEHVFKYIVPSEEVSAIVFEPIQWEGCVIPPKEFFRRISRISDAFGLIMVDDESKCGLGRIGRWFAIEKWEITPDILCLSDTLASGIPLGALIARSRIMDWTEGSHESHLSGNPIACSAALSVIEVIRNEKLLENAEKVGRVLFKGLNELKEECQIIGDVRGSGLIVGIEIVKPESLEPNREIALEILRLCFKRGILPALTGESTIVLSPPLNISIELAESGLEILLDTIKMFY